MVYSAGNNDHVTSNHFNSNPLIICAKNTLKKKSNVQSINAKYLLSDIKVTGSVYDEADFLIGVQMFSKKVFKLRVIIW